MVTFTYIYVIIMYIKKEFKIKRIFLRENIRLQVIIFFLFKISYIQEIAPTGFHRQ